MTVYLIVRMEITNPERFSDYEPVRAIRWEAAHDRPGLLSDHALMIPQEHHPDNASIPL